MILSTVDSRPLQVALYQGAKWFNWKSSTQAVPVWEATFSPANHLLSLTADTTFPTLQSTSVPNWAVTAADSMVVYSASQPVSTVSIPPNMYLGLYPGTFATH